MGNFEIMLVAQHIEEFMDHVDYVACNYLSEIGIKYRDIDDLEFCGDYISIRYTLPGCGCCPSDREWTSMPTNRLWKEEYIVLE